MKSLVIWLGAMAVAAAIIIGGIYALNRHSQAVVIADVAGAITRGDTAALSARVNWPALRHHMRASLNQETATLIDLRGGLHAPAGGYASAFVNHYARQDMLADLLADWQQAYPGASPRQFIGGVETSSLTEFTVSLCEPDRPMAPCAQAVFALHKLTWQLSNVRIPSALLVNVPLPGTGANRPAVDAPSERL